MKKLLVATIGLAASTASAFAADLPSRRAAPAMPYIPPAFTWTGAYVGINAGGTVGGDFSGTTLPPLPALGASTRVGGFVAGGTAGYNYQLTPGNGFVIGVEGDIGYTDIGNRITIAAPGIGAAVVKAETDTYLGTIRGRLGYAWGQWLVYGTGGAAFTEATLGLSGAGFGLAGSLSSTKALTGYAAGGGIEYAVMPSLSVKAEYLYHSFDNAKFAYPAVASVVGFVPRLNAGFDAHTLKVGVNYRFNAF